MRVVMRCSYALVTVCFVLDAALVMREIEAAVAVVRAALAP